DPSNDLLVTPVQKPISRRTTDTVRVSNEPVPNLGQRPGSQDPRPTTHVPTTQLRLRLTQERDEIRIPPVLDKMLHLADRNAVQVEHENSTWEHISRFVAEVP